MVLKLNFTVIALNMLQCIFVLDHFVDKNVVDVHLPCNIVNTGWH